MVQIAKAGLQDSDNQEMGGRNGTHRFYPRRISEGSRRLPLRLSSVVTIGWEEMHITLYDLDAI